MGNAILQGAPESTGNARANIPDASEERDNRGASGFFRILFKHYPGTQSVRRFASSNRFKTTEHSHFRTSFLYAHYKLSTEYNKKRRLRIQNISAGCVILCTNPSRQQVVPKFCLQKQGISVPSTFLQYKHCPSGIYSSGAHSAAYLHCQGISVISYLDDWLIHHPDCQVLLCHQSQLLKALELIGLKLNEGKSETDPVQDFQFLGLRLCLDQGKASLPESKAREIIARACRISSQPVMLSTQVSHFMGSLNCASGLIPLGCLHLRPLQPHFHSLGLTNWFTPPRC